VIVKRGSSLKLVSKEFVLKNWYVLAIVLSIEFLINQVSVKVPAFHTTVFSASAVAMLATVVGIFLVFRFDNAYKRWWEARTLWGQLVNSSRNLGRQVCAMITEENLGSQPNITVSLRDIREALLYRQIAFVNALRIRLREENNLSGVEEFISEFELAQVKQSQNVPLLLMQLQLGQLTAVFNTQAAQQLLLLHIDRMLSQLTDIQGSCERIKLTPFPDTVRFMSRVFVWGIALLIPAVFLEPEQAIYPIELVVVVFISLEFVIVDQLALSLMDPFDNTPNDTPMSAMCRGIERDLKQQLGETDLPPLLKPVNGVLM
jgi:putative membrane protein